MSQFSAYLDESGHFAPPVSGHAADTVVVAGLLVAPGGPPFEPGRLCDLLEGLAPEIPWPWHGWLVRQTAAHLLWQYRFQRGRASTGAPATLPAQVVLDEVDYLGREVPVELERALGALDRGHEPDSGDLAVLRRSMSRTGRRAAEARRDDVLEGFADAVAACARRSCVTAAGSATERRPLAGTESAAWRAQLGLALKRVFDLAALYQGRTDLVIEVQSRGHIPEELDSLPQASVLRSNGRWPEVRPLDVLAAARGAGVAVEGHSVRNRGTVRMVPARVVRFGPGVRAEHVVADFVANGIRGLIHRRVAPDLASLERTIQRTVGVPLRLEAPALAAPSPVQDLLDAHRSGQTPFKRGGVGWEWDQAEEWARRWL